MSSKDFYFEKKDEKTSLYTSICTNDEEEVRRLLANNAAASIFAEGNSPDSIVCTLPQARQPYSAAFNYDEPFTGSSRELLDDIDNSLAIHIESLIKKETEEKMLFNTAAAAAVIQDATATIDPNASKFNAFPAKLKDGDRVLRGPSWSASGHNNEDNGGEGVVKIKKGLSATNYTIKWDKTGKEHVINYDNSKQIFDVQLVDPSTVTAASQVKAALFVVGDLVQVQCDPVNPYAPNTGTNVPVADATSLLTPVPSLESKTTFYYGVIVSINNHNSADPEYTVASLSDGTLQKVDLHKMLYADGSSRGFKNSILNTCTAGGHDLIIAAYQGFSCPTCGMGGPSPQSSDLYCAICNSCAVCASKYILCTSTATVIAQSTHSVVKASSGVNCACCKKPSRSNETSDYICSVCKFCSPCAAKNPCCGNATSKNTVFGPLIKSSSVFMAGDRVQLSDQFSVNGGNGWCLGTAADNITGIVLYAPDIDEKGNQRNIVVAAVDKIDQPFKFKSSWLKHAPNNSDYKFKIGDRVQLDRQAYLVGSTESCGKCLRSPGHYRYGIVTAIGPLRDGIVRNIQVKLPDAIAEEGPRVSFYPSNVLVPAVKQMVLTSQEYNDLLSLSNSIAKFDFTSHFSEHGINVWSKLAKIGGVDAMKEKETWESQRNDRAWPDMNEDTSIDDKADLIPPGRNAVSDEKMRQVYTWKCGSKCEYNKNCLSDKRCKLCNKNAPTWACVFCSAQNSMYELNCKVCDKKHFQTYRHTGVWRECSAGSCMRKSPTVNGVESFDSIGRSAKKKNITKTTSQQDSSESDAVVCCSHSEETIEGAHWSCCGVGVRDSNTCMRPQNVNITAPINVVGTNPEIKKTIILPSQGFDIGRAAKEGITLSNSNKTATFSNNIATLYADRCCAPGSDLFSWTVSIPNNASNQVFGFVPENTMNLPSSSTTTATPSYSYGLSSNSNLLMKTGVANNGYGVSNHGFPIAVIPPGKEVTMTHNKKEKKIHVIADKKIIKSFDVLNIDYRFGIASYNNLKVNFVKSKDNCMVHGFTSCTNEVCRICPVCDLCTGYGKSCASKAIPKIKGSECGCGIGDPGCQNCGVCKSCCALRNICGASLHDGKAFLGDKFASMSGIKWDYNSAAAEYSVRQALESEENQKSMRGNTSDDSDSDYGSDVDSDSGTQSSDGDATSAVAEDPELLDNIRFTQEYTAVDTFDSESSTAPVTLAPGTMRAMLERLSTYEYVQQEHYKAIDTVNGFINYRDKEGSTAAHYAAQIGLHKTLQVLLGAG